MERQLRMICHQEPELMMYFWMNLSHSLVYFCLNLSSKVSQTLVLRNHRQSNSNRYHLENVDLVSSYLFNAFFQNATTFKLNNGFIHFFILPKETSSAKNPSHLSLFKRNWICCLPQAEASEG